MELFKKDILKSCKMAENLKNKSVKCLKKNVVPYSLVIKDVNKHTFLKNQSNLFQILHGLAKKMLW